MTLANIAIYLAVIVLVIARRMIGRPVGPVKKQFVLPVVIVVIGWSDATKGLNGTEEHTLVFIGCAVSLALGLARGAADRLSVRDGAPYVQWTWLSLGLFAVSLLAKLGLDLASVATGGTAAVAGKSLLLTLGLTLLGEAAVVWYRTGGAAQLGSAIPAAEVTGREETEAEDRPMTDTPMPLPWVARRDKS